ncbi:MAG TPA: transposase [Pyrinomonadaceae bacterium]|nr:transposase [Pyrinomonadaceae bacterium]
MSQSFTNLLYHLIFSTKDRRPLITLDYQPRLYDYIGGIIRGTGGISLGIDGMEDHVHVLAKLRPDRALSDVLRDLKSKIGLDARCFSATVRLLVATRVCSIHREPVKSRRSAEILGAAEGTSSKSIVPG